MSMRKPIPALVLAAAATLAVATTAAAGDYDYDAGTTYYIEAPVVHVEPITRRVSVSEPREVCRDVRVHHTERGRGRGNIKGAIVGSILGGAIGNNVAHGEDDRQTARLAGAVLGGVLGHGVGRGHDRGRRVVRTERRCETEHVSYREERVTAYRVTYRYDGRRLTTRRKHHPGDHIRLRVRVDPGH